MKYILLVLLVFITGKSLEGTASYYSDKFDGRKTASGQIFRQNKLTAASNYFKLGDSVKVINLQNKKVVHVLINDRMSYNGRVIDLSYAAADSLDFIRQGLTRVKVELL